MHLDTIKELINEVIVEEQESTGYSIIDEIIKLTEPLLNKIIIKLKQDALNKLESFTSYDEEFIKLSYRYDLIKALSSYILKTDYFKFVNVNSFIDKFEIKSVIIRNGIEYAFNTDIIDAGGYNIQRYHYRYIVKTKLPKIPNPSVAQSIATKIKRLSKQEKIRQEIKYYENLIANTITKIENAEQLSDNDIIKQNSNATEFINTTWQTIVDRGADKNFDYDKNKFDIAKAEHRDYIIKSYKLTNIISPKRYLIDYKLQIKKLQDKLELI